jgi:GNAT superfamily N-acetyltransferase
MSDARPIVIRQATMDDAQTLFTWRNDPVTIAGSRSQQGVEWDGHVQWLTGQLPRNDRVFLIGVSDAPPPVGLVWFALNRGNVWETSVSLEPLYRGQGMGVKLLTSALDWMRVNRKADAFSTEIGETNTAAIKMYERCGYRYIHPSPGYGTYFLSLK